VNKPTEATSLEAPLLEVWMCSGCERQTLAIRHRGRLIVEHEVTGEVVAETLAAGGWRLARRCGKCGGIVEILYAHAALTRSGKLIVFRDRGYTR